MENSWSADGPEIAAVAGIAGRHRSEEARLDGTIDHLQDFETHAARAFVQRNRGFVEAAIRGTVEKTTVADQRAQRRFDRHRIQHRLQNNSATNDDLLDLVRLAASLVVDYAQHLGRPMLLDQIDRSL